MRVYPLRWSLPLGLVALSAFAQPPPSALPPIAPAQARLAQTLGLEGPGSAIAYSESAGILAAGCESGAIVYWNRGVALGVRAGDGTPNVLRGHEGSVLALAWDNGSILASAGADRKVLLWSMPEGTVAHSLSPSGLTRALALSPSGKLLATGGDGGTVELWDATTAKPTVKLAGHSDWVLALAFNPDGKVLASGGYDGKVLLWDVPAGTKLREIVARPPMPPDATNIVTALAFSPDGKQLAVGGSDSQIHFFTIADGKLVRSLPGHTSSITGLVFHPSGTLLGSASKDRTVRLWNPANGQPIKTLEGHAAWVQGVALVGQGTRLASVGADETVRLWDLTAPGK
jgi:WD40 repeat protein